MIKPTVVTPMARHREVSEAVLAIVARRGNPTDVHRTFAAIFAACSALCETAGDTRSHS
jgi:hypothetical protein